MTGPVKGISPRVDALRREHNHLHSTIESLSRHLSVDPLQVRRLKKRKLLLKDAITRLESRCIPDLEA